MPLRDSGVDRTRHPRLGVDTVRDQWLDKGLALRFDFFACSEPSDTISYVLGQPAENLTRRRHLQSSGSPSSSRKAMCASYAFAR